MGKAMRAVKIRGRILGAFAKLMLASSIADHRLCGRSRPGKGFLGRLRSYVATWMTGGWNKVGESDSHASYSGLKRLIYTLELPPFYVVSTLSWFHRLIGWLNAADYSPNRT